MRTFKMKAKKTFKSVTEMTHQLSEKAFVKKDISKTLYKKKVSKSLFLLRCKANLTQKEFAEKLQCSQSRISKIESSLDENLTLKDLADYAHVLGMKLELGYKDSSIKLVDEVKFYAFKIMSCLEEMAHLAKDDESMIEGVKKFYMEAFLNLNKLLVENFTKLRLKKTNPDKDDFIDLLSPLTSEDIDRHEVVTG